MDGVTTNFIWPSDIDRAESSELNRVCEHAEDLQAEVEHMQQQNDYLSALASGQPLYGLEEKIADLMQRNKALREEVERLRAYTSDTDQWTRKLEQTVLDISEERDQLKDLAIELCDAVENKHNLPLTKYTLKCGRLVNQLRQQAKGVQS